MEDDQEIFERHAENHRAIHNDNFKRFSYFIKERYAIMLKKNAGAPLPWTKDNILQHYRFCNVQREDDKVTKWIAKNWRNPNKTEPHLWFAMVIARHLNTPDALEELGYPTRWNSAGFLKLMANRKAKGKKNYSAAYMIVPSGTVAPKTEYLAEEVFTPMWQRRHEIAPRPGDTLASFFARLNECRGMGSFLTAQVIADMKYVAPLSKASDWWTWASSGPGSRRGLNRLLGKPIRAPLAEPLWLEEIQKLRIRVNMTIKEVPNLHAQDVQNCLCEFDKYERARLEEGVPKQRYKGV